MKPIIQKLWTVMAMLYLSISAFAYDFEVDSMYYSIVSSSELTVKLVGFNPNWSNPIVDIPSHVTFNERLLSVVSTMDYSALKPNKQLIRKVNFPYTMKYIGDLFSKCPNL